MPAVWEGPKDGDSRAGYALVTVAEGREVQVEFVRQPYDVEKTAGEIEEFGLPTEFAAFLRTGGK